MLKKPILTLRPPPPRTILDPPLNQVKLDSQVMQVPRLPLFQFTLQKEHQRSNGCEDFMLCLYGHRWRKLWWVLKRDTGYQYTDLTWQGSVQDPGLLRPVMSQGKTTCDNSLLTKPDQGKHPPYINTWCYLTEDNSWMTIRLDSGYTSVRALFIVQQ